MIMMCGVSGIVSLLVARRCRTWAGSADTALFDDGEAVAFEPDDGAVRRRQQDHLADPEDGQNLRADAIVAPLGPGRPAGPVDAPHPVEKDCRRRLTPQDDDAAAD